MSFRRLSADLPGIVYATAPARDAGPRGLARRYLVSAAEDDKPRADAAGSKEQFWRAVIDRALTARVTRLVAVLNVPGEDELTRLRDLVHAFHQANVAEPDLARILRYESIQGGPRLEYVFQRYLMPVRDVVAPLVQTLVDQGRVRPFPIDLMVYAVVAMNAVHAEKPLVSLLGDSFAVDPNVFTRMLSDVLLRRPGDRSRDARRAVVTARPDQWTSGSGLPNR